MPTRKARGQTYYFGNFPQNCMKLKRKLDREASQRSHSATEWADFCFNDKKCNCNEHPLKATAIHLCTRGKQNSVHTSVDGCEKCGPFGRVIWTMRIGYIHYSLDVVYTYRQHHRFCERHHWPFWRTPWTEWMYNPFYLSKCPSPLTQH